MPVIGFLKTIKEIKQEEIAAHQQRIPLPSMRQEAEKSPVPPDFSKAMASGTPSDVGIIAEIKKASPSKGDLCVALDVKTYAQIYEKAGAKAVSVLTEPVYFKGSLTDLATVCAHTGLPVLRKDFVFHEYQIYEARRAGAASILIMTTLLSAAQQADFISLAREIHMEPLVEIASEREMAQALKTGATIVGINNRNLTTLKMDPEAAIRIAPLLPKEIIPVAASGFSSRADILKGIHAGIFNFLIGESIVRSSNPDIFITSLRTDV
jgi:indole-3-glycerol phosphate synthase/indole-3-glycerol phosphate synthase/phosphoribosylanthranilate isomerase